MRKSEIDGELQKGQPFLSLHQTAFRLGDRLVFQNSSWTLFDNQQWVAYGTNGSGKSLFADAIRGKLPLVAGELQYHFQPRDGTQSPEDSIGYVSFQEKQAAASHSILQSRWESLEEAASLPVREFCSFERVMEINPFELTRPASGLRATFQRRLRTAFELLDLERFLDHKMISLSNGEMQKVYLARTLARPLCLLILDEPFEGLDSRSREEFRQALGQLMQTKLRLLLLTARKEGWPDGITHQLTLRDCQILEAGRFDACKKRARVRQRRGVPLSGTRRAPGNATVLARMKNVTVRYGNDEIVTNVSWTIREGESWALLGPNGAGKTTLLGLLCGDHPQAYQNEIEIFGRKRGEGESIWDIKQKLGSVSPESHLHFGEEMSCYDAVASGLFDSVGLFERLTRPQIARTMTWLRQFGLVDYASQPLYALSTGMQRMTLLARALVKEPRLLILDEPCQGLDTAHRQLFLKTIDDLLYRRVTTVIYVTHHDDEIPRAIRCVLRLNAGKVIAEERL